MSAIAREALFPVRRLRSTATAVAVLLVAACSSQVMPAPPPGDDDEARLEEAATEGRYEEDGRLIYPRNRAGCDPGSPVSSCGNAGACCDTHDECISRPVNRGTTANPKWEPACPPPYGHYKICREAGNACPPECRKCQDDVRDCGVKCTTVGGKGCGKSTCCDAGTCDKQEACYDRSKNPPELITDPCECERRGLDLSPSPPRSRFTCCDATGYGCCAGMGTFPTPDKPCCTGTKSTSGGRCEPDGSGNFCGDGVCGGMESRYSCPSDCDDDDT